ncbi:MAG: anti-sigma factor domain-containing protein [Gemmatimonadales bacterium]
MSATIPESIREMAAGYALGALSPEETRVFEAALAQSGELQREVAEYREVNALLALSGGAQPDAAVKDRLMARISEAKAVPLGRAASRRIPWMAMALAATGLLAVGLGGRMRWLERQLLDRDATLAATAAKLAKREETLNTLLMAEAGLTVVHLTTSGDQAPGMQLFWNRLQNRAVLHAFRLPPATAGKVYQLWLIPRDGKPIPSTTFNSESDGHALVEAFQLPTDGGFDAAAITIEPAGGSTAPTMPIILVGRVTGP